ncbi:DUF1127 domain-containing protein [Bosea sp. BH3]|uniref:DUF1127 domain-containing protein n=1 Tax=Bosea sp. BH3 TaxID=2871701 RepID=UPI0021CB0EFB|nr:DUF1127 domain-containing protein [Bosea sp. BH3]MCU4179106.1 DUF1127 domain-containing protein [Bosea sp. BH3]
MLLMTVAAKSLSSVSAGATRVAVVGSRRIIRLTRALIHRREVMFLGELDERGLKDIGLVRSDIAGALATSWLDDPSTVLAARSQARSGVAAARREQAQRHAEPKPAVPAKPIAVARCA